MLTAVLADCLADFLIAVIAFSLIWATKRWRALGVVVVLVYLLASVGEFLSLGFVSIGMTVHLVAFAFGGGLIFYIKRSHERRPLERR